MSCRTNGLNAATKGEAGTDQAPRGDSGSQLSRYPLQFLTTKEPSL